MSHHIQCIPQTQRWNPIVTGSFITAAAMQAHRQPTFGAISSSVNLPSSPLYNIRRLAHIARMAQKLTLCFPSWISKAEASSGTVAEAETGSSSAPLHQSSRSEAAEEAAPRPTNGGTEGRTSRSAESSAQASSSSNGSDSDAKPPQLTLKAAAAMIPHPEKADRGGEDAYFISEDGLTLGVADGVGSWAEIGINAGLYSAMLMSNAKKIAERAAAGPLDPKEILREAHSLTDVEGSSTACIVMLQGSTLRAANLGDSGFFIIRSGKIVFKSPSQQRQFNFPLQLSAPGTRGDSPSLADAFEVAVRKGDVVVLATDGLIDNVFPEETAALINTLQKRGDPPRVAAAGLADFARFRSEDKKHMSPFAFEARRAGLEYSGGKPDDITAVVAYVAAASNL